MDVIEKKRKRKSVDVENFRQQIGKKFGLEKAAQYKKKVEGSYVDIIDAHCSI